MKRITAAVIITTLLTCATGAQARGLPAGTALLHARSLARTADATAGCPAGVPVQTITVLNQAHASAVALAKVENAVVAQSMQLRAAWDTPCVQFGPGGWPLYLRIGGTEWGVHYALPTTEAIVYTDGLTYVAWSATFSHEVMETLVDPTTTRTVYLGERMISVEDPVFGETQARQEITLPVEVADPVGERGYRLDGVWVSDFVTPAWFAGAPTIPDVGCDPTQNIACSPPIAPAGAPGPYDEMGILDRPLDTTWERPDQGSM